MAGFEPAASLLPNQVRSSLTVIHAARSSSPKTSSPATALSWFTDSLATIIRAG